MLIDFQNTCPNGYPYVFVPPRRYDYIQNTLRTNSKWSLNNARTSIVNNFTRHFHRILKLAGIKNSKFHDLRRTAITNWFRQGLSELDVMTLSGHANFGTTHKFYLKVADNLVERARKAAFDLNL